MNLKYMPCPDCHASGRQFILPAKPDAGEQACLRCDGARVILVKETCQRTVIG